MSAARSRLLAPVVGLLAGAALLWASSRLTWLDVTATNDQSGTAQRALTGARWQPALVPVALGVLAAVAAVALARGVAARVVGVVLVLLGVACAVPALGAAGEADRDRVLSAVTASDGSGTTTSGVRGSSALPAWSVVSDVRARPLGPALAGLAAVCVLAAGVSVLLRPPARRAADDRYAAPTSGGERPPAAGDPGRELWDSLDAGDDPTAGEGPGGTPVSPAR